MADLTSLIELDRLAREDGKKYVRKRFLYDAVSLDRGRHFLGITGPRGVGKTILLKQIALNLPETFYLSVDTFQDDLFETVKALRSRLNVKVFLLDEVHMRSGFEADLKKIYDFLDVRIVFTSSVALAMYQSAHDLSRRVMLQMLYPFSFQEYVFFKYDRRVPALTLEDLIRKQWDRSVTEMGGFFTEYICGGVMPFAIQEPAPQPFLKNILQTVIYKDIARSSSLAMNELDTITRLVSFIGKSGIDGINYSSLSKNLGISKYKAEQYTALLEQAFILRRIWPKGTNVLKEPKIVMALPYRLLYRSYEDAVGGLREDFFVEAGLAAGFELYYLKSTRGEKTPDYVLEAGSGDPVVFEIGGKGKGRRQFKGFEAERKIILCDAYETEGIKRPLFVFGLVAKDKPVPNP